MKVAIVLAAGLIALSLSAGAAPDQDPVPDHFRSAYESYRANEYSLTIEQLREIITILEERTEKVLGEKVLPDSLGPWRGAPAKNEDLSFLGGGSSVSRIYLKGRDSITAKIVKDSPFVNQFIELIANDELLAWSGKEVRTIGGESAVLEGGKGEKPGKLVMAVQGRILVELVGSKLVSRSDLVAAARKLDLPLLRKLK